MESQRILSYIARRQKRRLLYPFLLLITVLFIFSRTPVWHYLQMKTLASDRVITKSIAERNYFVTAPVSELCYTGQDYWSDGQLTGHFYYTLIDGKCQYYVIRASSGMPAKTILTDYTVTGRIDAFEGELSSLAENMASVLDWNANDLLSVSVPYYVNETAYLTGREIFLVLILAAATLWSLAVLIQSALYWMNPKLAPAFHRLKKYGNPDEILAKADRQLSEKALIRTRDMVLTSEYLIEFSEDLSAVIPLESVLWTYDHASMRYTLKGKQLSYTLHVVTVRGDEFNLKNKTAEDVRIIYNELTTRFPDYFYGYSKEHQEMVNYLIRESEQP